MARPNAKPYSSEPGTRVEELEANIAAISPSNVVVAAVGPRGLVNRKEVPDPGDTNAGVISAAVADIAAVYGQVAWADLQPVDTNTLAWNNPIDQQLAKLKDVPACEGIIIRVNVSNWAPTWAKTAAGTVTAQSGDYAPASSSNVADDTTYAKWWTQAFLDAYDNLQALLAAAYDADPRVIMVTAAVGMANFEEPFQRNLGSTTRTNMVNGGYTAALNRAALRAGWQSHAAWWKSTPTQLAVNPYSDLTTGTTMTFIDDGTLGVLLQDYVTYLGPRAILANHSLRSRDDVDVSGSVTAATASTLTDSTKAWTTNAYAGYKVVIIFGGASKVGQVRTIISNTATALTISSGSTDWASTPTTAEDYVIVPASDAGDTTGTAAAGTSTIADTDQSWSNDQFNNIPGTSFANAKDNFVTIFTTVPQTRFITDTTTTTDVLTLDRPLDAAVAANTTYVIQPSPREALGNRYKFFYDQFRCLGVRFGFQTASSTGIGDYRTAQAWAERAGAQYVELNSDYDSNPGYEDGILRQSSYRLRASAARYPAGVLARRVKDSGNASAVSATTLTDSSKSWATNAYAGFLLNITGGTGVGQTRRIASNTGTVLTVETGFTTQGVTIGTDSDYEIIDPEFGPSVSGVRGSAPFEGWGTPEGVVPAMPGAQFRRLDGGTDTSFYVKETGTGRTGWVAK